MTNILMVYGEEEPTVLMLKQFFEKFSEQYYYDFLCKRAIEIQRKDMQWCDIAIFVRSQSMLEANLAAVLKQSGRLCVLFLDDDFLSIKDYYKRRRLQVKALIKILHISDIFISTNDLLAERMCRLGRITRYVRMDTAVNSNEICKRKFKNNNKIKIVYYTNQGISDDFDEIITPIIPKLYEKYGDRIEWTFFTVHPDLGEWGKKMKVKYVPRLPLNEFRKKLQDGNFDIGISPLKYSEFSKCKYINKFMEYSMAGIPGIYSNVEPYKSFIKHNITGILCNTESDWLNAVDVFFDNKKRNNCVLQAQKQLVEEFSEERILEKVLKSFPELCYYKATNRVSYISTWRAQSSGGIFAFLDPFVKAWTRMEQEGIMSVIRWIFDHYIWKRR